ncbi:MAG: alkaline phosphatase D family protein [Fuerstiella sp.]
MQRLKSTAAMFVIMIVNPVYGLSADIFHAQGELAGEVTATSVLLQSRLTAIPGPVLDESGDIPGAAGIACFEYSESSDFAHSNKTDWLKAEANRDFIVRALLTNLKAGQRYYYRLLFGANEAETSVGPTRQFRTLSAVDSEDRLTFCMGSCQNYAFFMYGKKGEGSGVSDEDKRLGYPSYKAMAELKPDFFIGTGDIVYYDHPARTAAKTLPELRKKWHEQARFPRLVEFFGNTATFWSKDDHDFRFNDADLGGDTLPLPTTGIDIFREQMPIHPANDSQTPTYRTHRVHKHLQLWFVEGRDYRSPNRMDDGPGKTIWGAEQREWLQRTLLASDATWKIIITPTPMVGPDSKNKKDNHTNLKGFRHEANSFFEWMNVHKLHNIMTFCGDRHWQYHSIHPAGMEEFSCGALNDENAISGSRPGTPNSTDPQGLIQQPFIYPEPTGGFLHVAVDSSSGRSPKLKIEFVDDHGKVQHTVEKVPLKKQ